MSPGGALLVALFVQSSIGAAVTAPDSSVTLARLEVRASVECMSRSHLASRVAARSQRIRFVDDAPILAQVSLRSSRPGNVIAELVLATAGVEQPRRRFVARSCGEAADAIAVIIALALDPTLKRKTTTRVDRGQDAAASDKTAGTPGATAPAANAESAATKGADQPADKPIPAPPPPVESPAPPPPLSLSTTRPEFGAQLAGQTIFGPAPGVMPGVAIYGMAALDREGPWAPALFVGVTRVWRSNFSEPGGTASFTLAAASLDACPLRLRWARVDARPCASGLLGRMASSGTNTDDPSGETRRFAAAGAAVITAVKLSGPVYLSIRVGVDWTLTRDWYEFGGAIFHRAAPVTTSASLGLGARWP